MEEGLKLVIKDTIIAGIIGFIGIILAKLLLFILAIAFIVLVLYALGYLKIDEGLKEEMNKIRDLGLIPLGIVVFTIFLAVMFPTNLVIAMLGAMLVGAGLGYLGYNIL
jgi:UDP-N-acetylmuramyl pentapeptide phosphotransferase/UDP-N-acetylglucosamine-1-phosphate transferase